MSTLIIFKIFFNFLLWIASVKCFVSRAKLFYLFICLFIFCLAGLHYCIALYIVANGFPKHKWTQECCACAVRIFTTSINPYLNISVDISTLSKQVVTSPSDPGWVLDVVLFQTLSLVYTQFIVTWWMPSTYRLVKAGINHKHVILHM